MSMSSEPLPDHGPLMDKKQFLERLKQDPGFVEKMQARYEAALALPENPETTQLRASAGLALRKLKHYQGTWLAGELLLQARGVIDENRHDLEPADLRRMLALTDEASDHLLDVMEPDRTRFMTMITELREMIRRLVKKSS